MHLVWPIQDPISRAEPIERMWNSAEIAFHAVGNGHPSIANMKLKYHINCDDDAPLQHCRDGKLMVNLRYRSSAMSHSRE